MINENQKKTTQKYRDNYDKIFGKRPKITIADDIPEDVPNVVPQTITPNGDCMVGGCTSERDDVAEEREPGSRPLGQGDL